jgi:hypothetical protein
LLALIRPEFGQVCQRLIVVSYCTPGSPQCQAHSAIRSIKSFASYSGHLPLVTDQIGLPLARARAPRTFMNSSVTRTERLAFWKRIEL